jgi:LmbE family N-acetylglucosaminyl deacetylase
MGAEALHTQNRQGAFSWRETLGERLLVVIPHEDDEINVAGATIAGASEEGVPVYCVFVTHGDWEFPASVRIGEAIKSLSHVGVPRSHIYFLGYPDGGAQGERNVFLHGQDHAVQAGKHAETYRAAGIDDYSFQANGVHHAYTWENLLSDLQQVILDVRPDTIIGTGFDHHPDHRMTYLALEQALRRILTRPGNDWFPQVLFGFAYATSYAGTDDFYEGDHLRPTVINKSIIENEWDELEDPTVRWEERICFPVPADCAVPLFSRNRIFSALKEHVSQKAFKRAGRIINGDQVYWERRTDNLMMRGEVSASSGNPEPLHDFTRIGVSQIVGRNLSYTDQKLWVPEPSDTDKVCELTLRRPETVGQVVLYGNIAEGSRILDGEISLSNGYSIHTGPLAVRGRKTAISFPPQKDIQWVKFRIVNEEGDRAGLSEMEVFSSVHSSLHTILMTINGAPAGQIFHYPKGQRLHFSACFYPGDSECRWFIDGKAASAADIENQLLQSKGKHTIRVQVGESPVICECQVVPIGFWEVKKRHLDRLLDKLFYWREKKRQKALYRHIKKDI